jgi:hypothetical protein
MRKGIVVINSLVLIGVIFGICHAAEVLYDDFSGPEFNSSQQWRIVERGDVDDFFASHNNGRLRVSLTSDSIDRTTVSLRLPNENKLRKSMRAMVSLISADSRSTIGIRGELLNVKRAPSHQYNTDGDVFVQVIIENQQGTYRGVVSAEIVDAKGEPESELIPFEVVDTDIQLGTQYPMSISFDPSSKTITLKFGTIERQYTFDNSFDIFPLNVCQAAGVRIDIYTRQDEGTKTIIAEVDDVWVSEDYDPILGECPKPPNTGAIFLLLDE